MNFLAYKPAGETRSGNVDIYGSDGRGDGQQVEEICEKQFKT